MLHRTPLSSLARLAGCTCRPLAQPARLRPGGYSTEAETASSTSATTSAVADTAHSRSSDEPTTSSAYSTPSSSYKYSNPTDAYDLDPVPGGATTSHSTTLEPSHPASTGSSSSSWQQQDPATPDLFSSQPFQPTRESAHAPPGYVTKRSAGQSARQQRQTLSAAEAQTFAELLSQLMPDSSAGAGLFDSPLGDGKSSAAGTRGLGAVREAVGRKTGEKVSRWERKQRTELSLAEENELDALRERMAHFETDHELLEWAVREVFGYTDPRTTLFPDPRLGPPLVPAARGPNSRIYPDLLLSLFLLLRDTHRAPGTALSVFALAASTAHSYVSGCTTKLYNEVLRTRWAEGADVEGVAQAVDEMQRAGVKMDADTQRIVAEIGEAVQADRVRAELRAQAILGRDQLGVGRTASDVEMLVQRSMFFSREQVEAWARADQEVEQVLRQWEHTARARALQSRAEWDKRRERRESQERAGAHRASPNRFFRQPRDTPLQAFPARDSRRPARDFYSDEGDADERDVDDSWRNFPVDSAKSTYARNRDHKPPVPEEDEPWAALPGEAKGGGREKSLFGDWEAEGERDGPSEFRIRRQPLSGKR